MQLLITSAGAAIIRRINYPKVLAGKMTRRSSEQARLRPLLSEHDEQDARQTVALVLCQVGLAPQTRSAIAAAEKIAGLCPLFAGSRNERASYTSAARTLGLARWKACFRAVRSTLRIDRRVREHATDFSTAPDLEIAVEHPEVSAQRRIQLARKVWYLHSLLHAAKAADSSRNRRSSFRKHLATLRDFTAIWRGGFAREPLCDGVSENAIRMRLMRFRDYLEGGEDGLTAAALSGLPKGPCGRDLRSFAQIPENFAVAE